MTNKYFYYAVALNKDGRVVGQSSGILNYTGDYDIMFLYADNHERLVKEYGEECTIIVKQFNPL